MTIRPSPTWSTPEPAPWFGTRAARLMLASALATTRAARCMAQRSAQAVMDLERATTERLAALPGQRVAGMQQGLPAGDCPLPDAVNDRSAAARVACGHAHRAARKAVATDLVAGP